VSMTSQALPLMFYLQLVQGLSLMKAALNLRGFHVIPSLGVSHAEQS